ncbi:PucR family transcriptional regulator [Brevibacillus fluminis]|uniref:PucR family transcriptional regulator n=1 Tax=Brevibacillus fluminis TaxID=511487 RepID=A0A3M8CWC7_9BACL|nr:PucR family transcriptional regulator [Brevibacillus fluminis]RNB80100.1 PucR family transcriptional regulator [Brevibacillus fluminis]
MKVFDALQLPSLKHAKVVAGSKGLQRLVRWVHIVDLPDPLPWVRSGELLLTTGYSWPHEPAAQQALIRDLSVRGLAGLGLAVPHYFEQMPDAAIAMAEELQFPLIEIPWEVPFATITEEILNMLLTFHYKIQEQAELIHQELSQLALDAKSLQDIARKLGVLLKRSIYIQHADGSILASHTQQGSGETDRFDLEKLFQEKDSLLASHSTLRLKRLPADPQAHLPARIVCPISIKWEIVGFLWILEGQEPLSDLDQHAAQYAAILMAMHISHQRELASLEAQLGHSFLDSLLEGQFILTDQVHRRARLLGFDPEGMYAVGMLVFDSPIPLSHEGIVKRDRLIEKTKRRLQDLKMPTVLSFMQNQIFLLIPSEVNPQHFWQAMKGPDLSFAVSLPQQGFADIQQGYKEVCSILPNMTFGHFHRFQDLLVPRVLQGDANARATFLHKLFGPLSTVKNGDVLIQSLLTYARLGFHLKNTAEELNIHPKTLRYRLDRAISLGEFDLTDAETQFQLQLAVRIFCLHEPWTGF